MAFTPRYAAFPTGYAGAKYTSPFTPWNGSLNGFSPARKLRGGSQVLAIASVPADLSTLILNAPNGQSFLFQFVYNASVQTLGIKVPLPLSGASTAAQVTTALNTVLAAIGGTPLAGSFIGFPWQAIQGDATHVTINWTQGGALVAPTGTQATITVSGTVVAAFVLGAIVPAKTGPVYAFLPGD